MAGFLLFVLLPAYSQNRLVSFEKELQALETYKNTLGVSSIEYADQLANMAIVFNGPEIKRRHGWGFGSYGYGYGYGYGSNYNAYGEEQKKPFWKRLFSK